MRTAVEFQRSTNTPMPNCCPRAPLFSGLLFNWDKSAFPIRPTPPLPRVLPLEHHQWLPNFGTIDASLVLYQIMYQNLKLMVKRKYLGPPQASGFVTQALVCG